MSSEATSLEAYGNLKSSGLLTKQQHVVLQALKCHGDSTASELTAAILAERGGAPDPSYQKRLSELCRKGVVVKLPSRPCRVTKHSAIVWRAIVAAHSGPQAERAFLPPMGPVSVLSSVVTERQPPGTAVIFSFCACGTANARHCDKCGADWCGAPGHQDHEKVCPGVRHA